MTTHQVSALCAGLGLIILTAALLGQVARRLGQPAVIGEILAGVLLGPGIIGDTASHALLPTDIRPYLGALAQVGVAVFMFLVGTEVDRNLVRGTGRIAASVSAASVLLPCGLGVALGFLLLRHHPSGNPTGFVLFMGVAMSITAFPVLARILTDRMLDNTPLGTLSLCCAAVADVLAWILLALAVAVVEPGDRPWRLLLLAPYVLLMLFPVRLLLGRWFTRFASARRPSAVLLSTLFAGLLLSGAVTERLGLHFVFGAFLFGVVIPRAGSEQLRNALRERIGTVNDVLLLPVFFVVAGLDVDLSRLGRADVPDFLFILLAAIGGKFLGAFVAARCHGLGNRVSAALAILMNSRGLTELIILSVGLRLGFLDTRLYSMMVVMALVTTAMTGPLLEAVYPRELALRAGPHEFMPGRRPRSPTLDPSSRTN